MNLLPKLKHLNNGRRILLDWFGDGGEPVPLTLSSERAACCAGCLLNSRKPQDWLGRVTRAVARAILEHHNARDLLKLTTPFDGVLGTCQACDCTLALKVHVPLTHLLHHLSSEDRDRLDAGCWILRESAQPSKT